MNKRSLLLFCPIARHALVVVSGWWLTILPEGWIIFFSVGGLHDSPCDMAKFYIVKLPYAANVIALCSFTLRAEGWPSLPSLATACQMANSHSGQNIILQAYRYWFGPYPFCRLMGLIWVVPCGFYDSIVSCSYEVSSESPAVNGLLGRGGLISSLEKEQGTHFILMLTWGTSR